jgi:hypothetical protein
LVHLTNYWAQLIDFYYRRIVKKLLPNFSSNYKTASSSSNINERLHFRRGFLRSGFLKSLFTLLILLVGARSAKAGWSIDFTSVSNTAGVNGLSSAAVGSCSTNYAVYEFQAIASNNNTATINTITFGETGAATTNFTNIFTTTAYIYSSTSATYVPGTTNVAANLVGTATPNASKTLAFNTVNIPVSQAPTLYYFLVFPSSTAGPANMSFYVNDIATSAPTGNLTSYVPNNSPTYTFPATVITAANLTGTTAPTAIYYGQSGIAVAGISMVSNTNACGTLSSLVFSDSQSLTTFQAYFGATATLYTNTTATWGTGTAAAVATTGTTYGTNTITFALNAYPITTAATYFFLVINYTVNGVTLPEVFKFNPTSYTTSNGTVNPTYAVNTYTCTAPTVTATDLTAGLTAGPAVYYSQPNIAVAGISLVSNYSTPLSKLVFTVPQTYATLETYFGAPTLVTCPTTTYSSASAVTVTASSTSFTGTTLTYNFTAATVGTTASNYFLVFNYSVSGASLPQTFTFSPTGYTTGVGAVAPSYAYNTYTCTQTTVTATDITAGLTGGPAVYYGANNVAVAGISLVSNYPTALSQLVFTVPQTYTTLETYFGTPTLVTCPTTTYSAASAIPATASSTSFTGTTLTYNFTAATVGTAASNYFLVFNYNVAGGPLPQTFTFSPTGYTTAASGAVAPSYVYNTYTCTGATITATDLTAGLTTPATVYYGQTNIATAGISLVASASTAISQLTFTVAEGYTLLQGYFGTPTLVTCPTATYSSASATPVTTSGTSFTGTALTFNFSAVNLTTTTQYFFLVFNYNVAGGTLPQSFNFSPANYTTASGAVSTGYANNTYTCTAPTITTADLTAGLTTGPAVYFSQTNLAVAGISMSSNYSTTLTQLVFTVPQSYATLSGYFGTPTLVTCPTATYSSASATMVPTAGNSFAGTTLTFNVSSYTIPTTTVYFFLVLNYTVNGTPLPETFTFSPSGYTPATGSSAVTTGYGANTYTCTAPIVTATDLTAGLTASTVYYGQNNIAVAGISFAVNVGSTTLSQLAFTTPQGLAAVNGYFGTPILVTCTSATYSAASATAVPGTAVFGTNTATVNLSTPYPIGTSKVYFFLVLNYSVAGGTVPQTFTFSPTDYTTAASGAVSTGYGYNSYTCTAPVLTENINITGLATNPIAGNQTNIAIYGMSLASTGTSSITALYFTASEPSIVAYFPTVSLYSSASATFSTGTATLVQTQTSTATNAVSFTALTQNIASGVTTYYYLVVSYTESGTTPPASFQFTLAASGITTASAVTYNTLAGPAYTFIAGTEYWVGGAAGNRYDWNTAANWSGNYVPGAYDVAEIGLGTTANAQSWKYYPEVTTGTVTVGSIKFNANTYYEGTLGGGEDYSEEFISVSTGATLQVNGDITLTGDAVTAEDLYGDFAYLEGGGTVTCGNVNVNSSYIYAMGDYYFLQFANEGVTLILSDNINITSTYDTGNNSYPSSFVLSAGTTTLTGTLNTTNLTSGTTYGSSELAFSTALTAAAPATLNLANASALSGLSAGGTNTILFNEPYATVNYTGAAQTVYTNLTITGLTGGVTYYGLGFSGTGIKTPNGTSANALYVAGYFTNALTLNDATDYINLSATPVYFNGTTAAQNIYAGNGTGTTFTNVFFSGSKQSNILSGAAYVAYNGTLTMSGTASLNAGTGLLTLNSTSSGCAAIADITSTATAPCITGTVNVQRYVSAVRGYRLLSSPVHANTTGTNIYSINYISNSMYTTGSGTGFSGIGNPSVYLYDEGFVPQYTTFLNSNFIAISSLTGGTGTNPTYSVNVNGAGLTGNYSIPVGNAYYCFYRGNLSEGSANLTNPSYPAAATTLTATGTLNQGIVSFKDWYTPTSSFLGDVSQTYNLIGNPYACAIDLGTVQGTVSTSGIYVAGISSFIYELNPASGNYGIYTYTNPTLYPPTNGATEYIASGQGFFVQATGTSSTLTFNESAKAATVNANSIGLMAERLANFSPVNNIPVLRLKVAADPVNSDESIIAFNPKASSKYVFNEDAPHRAGAGIVEMSSMSGDNVKLAINATPLLPNMTIPLNVNATISGLYNIGLDQLNPLPSIYEIWLKDAYLKDSLDIKNNPVYNFDINVSDTSTYGGTRFSLVIRENPALIVHLLSFDATKAITGVNVVWTTENEQNYTNFTVQRSTDGGKTFMDLGALVSSAAGAYTFLDKNPVNGSNMYRLQMTDLNSNITYSQIVTIMYNNTSNQIVLNGAMTVYPNPTAGMINLSIMQSTAPTIASSASYRIEIVNNMGTVVRNVVSSTPTWQSDVTSLSPGTYFINVVNASSNSVVGKSAFVKL